MVDTKQLNAALLSRVLSLCAALRLQVRKQGASFCCGDISGKVGNSLAIQTQGKFAGTWKDWATGEGGDLINLIKAVRGVDFLDAIRWAQEFLGGAISHHETPPQSHRHFYEQRQINETSLRNGRLALALLKESHPINGTLGEHYFRMHRGLGDAALPSMLRFHQRLKHGWSGKYFPGIVIPVQAIDGHITAIHRIFLDPDTGQKASVTPDKASLGPTAGGAVRLAEATDKVVLTEGTEDALTLQVITGLPVWVPITTSGLQSVLLPPNIRRVWIGADNDPKRSGQDAAIKLMRRLQQEGRQVTNYIPINHKDFNDMHRAGGAYGS